MDRETFLKVSAAAVARSLAGATGHAGFHDPSCAHSLEGAERKTAVVNGWLDDLFNSIDAELDPRTKFRLLEGCDRAA